MSTSEEDHASGRSRPGARRWWLLALAGLVAVVVLAVITWDDSLDLREGVGAEQVGQDVAGSDLVVTDTIQSVGFFVDTDTGPTFVYYGDTTDRFGIGTTIAELEGEVAALTDGFLDELSGELQPQQFDRLAGYDVYVEADEIEVAPRAGS